MVWQLSKYQRGAHCAILMHRGLVGILSYCGLSMLIAQLGRDLGKKKEPGLFERWKGKPTTYMLRHRGTLNKAIRARYHEKLSIFLRIIIPDAKQEEADPAAADEIYDSCVIYLREKTRDPEKFRLVFSDNIDYGFRRNLWAMKPAGVILSLVGSVGCAILVTRNL